MRGFDLAPGLVIQFLLFQRLDLGFGENDALFGDLGLQGFQPHLEVGQVVAKPDAAHPAGRHEHTALAHLVADADLAVGRVFDGIRNNRFFRFEIDPVLRVGNPACLLQQRLDDAFLNRIAIAVKPIAGQAHDLTGLRHVAVLFSRIEKASFVTDDFLITL